MDNPESFARDLARDAVASIDILRTAKNAFFWLALVAIALHLAIWFTSRPAAASNSDGPVRPSDAAGTPSMSGGTTSESETATARFARILEPRLTLIGFVGRASVLVCAGIYIVCLIVSLVGRTGGTAGYTRSCVWSLIALAMVTPWACADSRQLLAFRSALFDENELYAASDGVLALIRFVILPALVAVCLLIAQLDFRRTHRRMSLPPSGRLPIHEV